MSLPSNNFLHLKASEIQPGQDFAHYLPQRPSACPISQLNAIGENKRHTAFNGCEVKIQ